MSIVQSTASHSHAPWFTRLRESLGAWRRRRAQYRALQVLDDRTLADIGIGRAEIGSVVAEQNGLAEPTRRRDRRLAWRPAAANSARDTLPRRQAA